MTWSSGISPATLRELGVAEDDIAAAGAIASSVRADVLNR